MSTGFRSVFLPSFAMVVGVMGTALISPLSSFEAYCTVTQSVGQGFPVQVRVLDVDGGVLHEGPAA